MESAVAASSEFPSVVDVEGDASEPSFYQAALSYLRQGLQALSQLSGSDSAQRAARDELLALQKQSLQLLHIHFASDGKGQAARDFGRLLKEHREAAGLTRSSLPISAACLSAS